MHFLKEEVFDVEAFERLFRKNFNPLCNKIYVLVRDKELAADIVQNVFLKFWKNRQQIKITKSIEAYLFKSCIYETQNYLKSDKRRSIFLKRIELVSTEESNPLEEEVQASETSLKIQQTIDQLPPVCRQVFLLSRYDDKSHEEIAAFLNISVNTVNNHIKKALKVLRRNLLLVVLSTLFFLSG